MVCDTITEEQRVTTKTTSSIQLLVLLACLTANVTRGGQAEGEEIFYADPTVYVENGKYYLTGTRTSGFLILESHDLRNWRPPLGKSSHLILEKGKGTFGTQGFWAPQLFKEKGKYYITYTANEQTCLASSDSLRGPFTQAKLEPIDGSEKNIDSFVFEDDDGKRYLYHVRFDQGNYLWVAEFDLQAGKIKPDTLTKCFNQTHAWEATPNYKSGPILEGPTVLKMKGTYYLIYSANHFRNIDYAVGYATSDSPYGPWKKYDKNPILHRSLTGENGTGHGDVFKGKDDKLYYVFHVHHSATKISPRRTRIVPLRLKWDRELNIYDISVDNKKLIKPNTKR